MWLIQRGIPLVYLHLKIVILIYFMRERRG